jgi:hypothetical protein
MTTSSDNRSPSPPNPSGEHWAELSQAVATKSQSVAVLEDWFDRQLIELEAKQSSFITHRSLRKNLRG